MKSRYIAILMFAFSLAIGTLASAQVQRPIEERIEAQRIAFITEKVNLTPQEAQAFWPVYNDHRAAAKDLRDRKMPAKSLIDMDDEEAAAFIDLQLDLEQMEHDLKVALIQDLKGIISPRKILRFVQAERQFKERLLRMMNQRRRGNNNDR